MAKKRGTIPAALFPVIVLLGIAFTLLGARVKPDIYIPHAQHGLLDLTTTDFSRTGQVELKGEWEFYPEELLAPSDFNGFSETVSRCAGYVNLPDEGQLNPASFNADNMSPYGYASWRLILRCPGRMQDVSLRVPEVFSSTAIFLNGNEIFSAGQPGKTADTTRHWYRTGIVHLDLMEGDNELVIRAANFGERRGGMNRSLWIGSGKSIQSAYIRSFAMDMMIFGSLLAMGLYHLCLFWVRRRDRSALWFGLFCLIMAVRSLIYGERFAFNLFPNIPWEVFNRFDHLTFYIGLPIFSAYIMQIFPRDINRIIMYIYQGLGLVFALMLFFPPTVFNATVTWYEMITAAYVLYILFIIVKALVKKRDEAKITMIGIGLFLCFGINEILFNMGIINTFNSLTAGLVLFLFTQSVLISIRFSKAFDESELLGKSLLDLNKSLRRFIPQEFFMLLKKRKVEDIQLGDQVEKNMSIMFTDIRNFTLLAEQLGAANTFKFLNTLYGRIGEVIRAHGGFIDKYLGDGFIALFPESPDSALKSAIGIQKVINEINAERAADSLSPITIGIGLNYGQLILGTVGEQHRMDTTVIADSVNLCSRLEGLTKQYGQGIIVPFEFLDLLVDPEIYHWRYLGLIRVQGRKQAAEVVHIYDGLCDRDFNLFNSNKDRFEDALHAYRNGDYEAAMQDFRKMANDTPDDPAVFTFMTQIHRLMKSGLGSTWDGIDIVEK